MNKVCDICGGDMLLIFDSWNFRKYWFCLDCGWQERFIDGDSQ